MSGFVLVINTGSSSLKYSLVDGVSGTAVAVGLVERIGEEQGRHSHRGPDGESRVELKVATHEDALRAALDAFETHGPSLADVEIVAVGHRVVHGGSRFADPVLIDDEVIADITELVPLAPLHNPANLEGIRVAQRLFPQLPQVAVFDTAFHQTLPPQACTYAVPREWLTEHGIRRYGFHGTSHAFVSAEAARLLGGAPSDLNLIVLHLGNGCSATAVRGGRSVDTSMGMTPLEGLVMGTRSGDLDPAIPAHLTQELGWSAAQVDRALNSDSGLKGLVEATTTSANYPVDGPRETSRRNWPSTCTATESRNTSARTTPRSAPSTPSSSPPESARTPQRYVPRHSKVWNAWESGSMSNATTRRPPRPVPSRPTTARSQYW